MMRKLAPIGFAAALCISWAFAMAGESAEHSGTKEEQEACTPDVYRLCAAQIPNEKRIVACLKRKKSQLSPACRKVMS